MSSKNLKFQVQDMNMSTMSMSGIWGKKNMALKNGRGCVAYKLFNEKSCLICFGTLCCDTKLLGKWLKSLGK